MAVVLMMSSLGNMSVVSAKEIRVQSDSNAQMSSDPEVVYVNTYDASKREQNFDSNWKFYLGDASGAENANFDDSRWQSVNLPHDYSIEQEYSKSMEAESGYLPGGTGWYRKHFTLDNTMQGKEIRIDFGGVYMNASVWVNGTKLGTHPYGYTPFSFDITDYVRFDKENVITVKVDHKTPSSRWYSGSGIYRSVNLTVTEPVHVDLYGTQISTPNLETEKGKTVSMNVTTTVANAGDAPAAVVLTHTIYAKGTENSIGTVTTDAQTVAAGETADITAVLPASNPQLWSTKSPNLYTVRTEVKVADNVVDTYDTEYGFRYFDFDTETGFSLNGEKMKLKGVCMHHDQGSLGAEAYYRAIERQVEILKDMGCNSIRVTHNPAADELIEICNEKGILVVEEFFDGWMHAKNGNSQDYARWFNTQIESGNEILGAKSGMTWAEFDMKSVISRGENAPSIIMWSLGNEIQEGAGGSGYSAMADSLITWAQQTGTTKLLTIGSNAVKNGWDEHIQIANKITAAGGVSGTNYSGGSSYDALHRTYPNWCLYGSETASSINSRGIYYKTNRDNSNQDLTSYDNSAVGWGALASSAWYDVITRDFVAGEYVWTGFDYIGEPTPWNGTDSGAKGTWPSPKNSFFGIIDTAGFPKDSYYFYQSQWNDDVNTLHILPAWNSDVVYKDGSGNVPVVVYSDAASVKLTFTNANGQVTDLGTKEFKKVTTASGYTYQVNKAATYPTHQDLYLTWQVPYADGTITATAYDENGNVITDTVGRSSVTTTGEEAKLDATVDRTTIAADGKDLAYVTVDVKDAAGNIVPDAANRVKIAVSGDGVLVGVDNGNQTDHDSYQANNRKAYSGKMLAIVQSTKEAGSFTVTASAEGLTSDSVTVTTTPVEGQETQTRIASFYMSRYYYVNSADALTLPTEIVARYTNGTSSNVPVEWNIEDLAGTEDGFVVNGTAEGYQVSVVVNVIDGVAGLLNYSTTTSRGNRPILPESRPAVLADGTILNVSFPVTWDEVSADSYAAAGTFVVNGSANVLGIPVHVTASIRVQEETISIGDSVSGAAKLSQDIVEDLQSDTLSAIKDGNTAIGANPDGGANPTAWTNYNNSQTGDNTAEIVFEYDTQQRIGQIVIHFFKDSYSARYPDAGTTEIYYSDDGNIWTKLAANETIGTESSNVTPYTYAFSPIAATFVKFCLTNKDEALSGRYTCTGITEIELKKATGTFTTNTTAAIASMEVNGESLTAGQIASGAYYTLDQSATVTAEGADNAAVTVLPAYNDKILVIIESEDHLTRNEFVIHLNEEAPVDPEDSSRDYPVDQLTAISDSQYPGSGNEGPDDYILDGNPNTHWHTNWDTSEATSVAKRWVGVSLDEAAMINGIRYLPRQSGNTNGSVTEYEVQYRVADDGEWITVATGNWESSDRDWKLVTFDAVTAKQVRIVGVHTYADSGNDAHMSTAEFRILQARTVTPEPEAQLAGISVKAAPKTAYRAGDSFDPAGLELNLIYSNGEVRTAAYRTGNASDFTFSLSQDLTADDSSVTITYKEMTTSLGITVTAQTGDAPALTPDDASRDYTGSVTPTAGSTYGDTIGKATDNNTGSFWETDWRSNNDGKLWFQLELEEAVKLEALRYYPRNQGTNLYNGDQNGFISAYRVEVSETGNDGEWTTVSTGRWAPEDVSSNAFTAEQEWLIAEFDAPVTAKYVRLIGVETLQNGVTDNRNMSIAEIRVRTAAETAPAEFTGISVKTAPNTVYEAGETFDPTGLVLNRVYSDNSTQALAYTEEAGITFEPAVFTTSGNNTVTLKYTEGGVEKTTTLDVYVKEPVVLTDISVETEPAKTTYTEGDSFNPEGLVLRLTLSNGSTDTISYVGNESLFSFEPGLDTALTKAVTSVKITYAGFETTQEITVNDPAFLSGIAVKTAPNKIVYNKGENLDPTGLVLTLIYSDTRTEEVVYSEANAADFGFAPKDDLQTTDERVTVTYQEKTAQIAIIVHDPDSETDPEAPEIPAAPETPEVTVPTTPAENHAEYEIYPNPQEMTYYEGAWILRTQANVICEEDIDEATKGRLEKTLSLKNMSATEGTELVTGKTNILVGTYGSDGYVDRFVKEHFTVSEDLFNKIDAYFLASAKDTIIVLGKDTDAAFYGLTSLYHIFAQMEGKGIESFIMKDWADTSIRGFIEGYYGLPWSNEDRMSLMEFGGNFKMTSYIFAPKDDPYHTSRWRELYPADELEAIAEMVELGNSVKCRFVWTAHPFMGGFNSNDVDGEIQALLNKFDQLYSVGVRQFGVLGDDVGSLNKTVVIRVMNAVSEWANAKGDVYDSVFCPAGYNHSWQGDYSELNTYDAGFPDDVQIFWTGEAVCQPIIQTTLDHFRDYNAVNGERRAPLFWLNWPVNDINGQRLMMGKGSLLHTDINAEDLAGVVTNPMQEAEASKVAIFAVADYAWNVAAFDDDQSWADSFAYIDADAAEEMHTLAKHMSNPQPNGHGLVLAESEELQPLINQVKAKLTAGQSLAAVGEELVAEMDVIIGACDGFQANSKNANLKDELLPFTGSLKDLATAIKNYTLAAMAAEKDSMTEAFEYFTAGSLAMTSSENHVRQGLNATYMAAPGSTHLIPLAEAFEKALEARINEYALGGEEKVVITASSSFESFYGGSSIENIVDGNNNTHAWHNGSEAVGQYYQVNLSKPSTVYGVEILNGAAQSGKAQDTFKSAKLQYTTDGTNWIDVPNGATTSEYQVTLSVSGLELENVTAVRYICTAAGNKWPSMREFTVKLTKEASAPEFTTELIRTTAEEGWGIHDGTDADVIDGNSGSYVWYRVRQGAASNADTSIPGDYIGVRLSQPISLGKITVLQGKNDSDGDYFAEAKLQYSADGSSWTDIGTFNGQHNISVDVSEQNITAQYVRLVNQANTGWVAFREFTVQAKVEYNAKAYTNADAYANVGANLGADTHKLAATDGVTLEAGEYIGLKLDRIHELNEIEINDGTIPTGLTLQVSKNSVEWDEATPGTVSRDARYIRLLNDTNSPVTFDITRFVVSTVEYEEKAIENTNYSSFDGEISRLFDGDWTTAVQFANSQTAGKYVVIDLGALITLESFKAVCRDSEWDYVRHGKFSVSADGTDWTEIMTIGSQTEANPGEADNTDNINELLPDHEISYNTKSVEGLKVPARFLKFEVTRTKAGADKWVRFQEFEINGGAYIPTENNPSFEGPGETADAQYRNLTDGNLSTMYTWYGDVIYHVSEETSMNAVKIIQNGISNATVSVRLAGDTDYTVLGTLSQTINEFYVGNVGVTRGTNADKQILDVKITTTEDTPASITELTLAKKENVSVDKAALEELINQPENTDNWTKDTKDAYAKVLAEARTIYNNAYASQTTVDSIVQAVEKAIASRELKGDPDAVRAELNKEVLAEGNYTAASWKVYDKAVNAAEEALRNRENLSEADAAALIAELKAAREALRYNPANYEDAALYLADVAVVEDLEDQYTAASYAGYVRLYNALEEMVGVGPQAQYTPQNFADAKDALKNAVKALVLVYELPELINEFDNTNESIYTEKTWTAYKEAVDAAREVLNSGSASQVRSAINAINAAKDKLAVKADKEAVEALIAQAEAYNPDDYTAKSYKALADKLTEIKAMDLSALSTAQLQNAGNALQDKINDLVSVKALKELVAQAETYQEAAYTTSSYQKLKEAVEKAKACYADGSTASVQKATEQLSNAIKGLTAAANKEDAQRYVDSIVLVDTKLYTKDSAKKYMDAYNKLKKLMENIADVSTAEFEAAKNAFVEARDGLVKVSTSDSTTDSKPVTVIPGASAQGAGTGDSANIMPLIVILLVAAAAFGFVQYKKKRGSK